MRTVIEPVIKVTLNLYVKDVQWFKDRYPSGYTERIRDAVRSHINYCAMEAQYMAEAAENRG